MMPRHRLLLAASIAFLATPVAAQDAEVKEPRQTANGEFLFDHYPPRALAAREQGKVGFRVTLDRDGSLTSCDVTQSSGSAALDNETCELIVRYAHFKPVRTADGAAVRATHDGFVNWKLPAELAGGGSPAEGARIAEADPDKIICKRSPRTGSLVGSTKQCMTRSEWIKANQAVRERFEPIQGKGWSQEGMPGT